MTRSLILGIMILFVGAIGEAAPGRVRLNRTTYSNFPTIQYRYMILDNVDNAVAQAEEAVRRDHLPALAQQGVRVVRLECGLYSGIPQDRLSAEVLCSAYVLP
jgi:hypothetical protein